MLRYFFESGCELEEIPFIWFSVMKPESYTRSQHTDKFLLLQIADAIVVAGD